MANVKFKVLSNEQKYIIAETLAKMYKFTANYLAEKETRNKAYGVIINTPDANGVTLYNKFGEEQSSHIVNLVIKILNTNNNKLTVSYDSLV